jgi:hypothetical protein
VTFPGDTTSQSVTAFVPFSPWTGKVHDVSNRRKKAGR